MGRMAKNFHRRLKFVQSVQECYSDSHDYPSVFPWFFVNKRQFTIESALNYIALVREYLEAPNWFGVTIAYLDTGPGRNCRYPRILKIIVSYISARKRI